MIPGGKTRLHERKEKMDDNQGFPYDLTLPARLRFCGDLDNSQPKTQKQQEKTYHKYYDDDVEEN